MTSSHQNKIGVTYESDCVNVIEDLDKYKIFSITSKDYIVQLANNISIDYTKLQIDRCNSNVDNELIGQLLVLLENNKQKIKYDHLLMEMDQTESLSKSSSILTEFQSNIKQIEKSAFDSSDDLNIIEIPSIIELNKNEDRSIKDISIKKTTFLPIIATNDDEKNIDPKDTKNGLVLKEDQIFSIYSSTKSYLNSCHLNLKLNIPANCIIGTVHNIHETYINLVSLFNDSSTTSVSIHKLINDISQINDSLNNIINIINVIKLAQWKILTFFERALDLLEKLNLNDFKVNYSKSTIDLKKGKLSSILIDCNQNPVFIFEMEQGINQQNQNESFIKIFTDCVREFQKKTNLDAFIFKYYERKIQNYNNNNENEALYIDDYIKNDFSSFIDFLLKSSRNFLSQFKSIDAFKKEFWEKIKNYKIFPNEKIPTVKLNEQNDINNWEILINIEKNHFPHNKKTLFNAFKSIFKQILNEDFIEENEQKIDLSNRLHGIFIKLTEEYRNKSEFYFYMVLLRNTIKKLLKKEDLDKIMNSEKIESKLFFVKTENYDYQTGYDLNFDTNFNFILKRSYKVPISEEIQEREKNILKQKYSKFIVNSLDEKDIFIPYFPYKTLYNLIEQDQISLFSNVDRIILIIEIATALKDLHSNNEYHGNLSSQSIFINSSKDAYIGSFAYDRQHEAILSLPSVQFYYRNPENETNESKDENIFKKQMSDIYSFGIVAYEILTGKLLCKMMQKMTSKSRTDIINNNYYEYLKKEDNNKVFRDDSFDLKGNSLIGFANIIEKCLKKEIKERYQSFDEIINYIKKTSIYIKNLEEIEYRFNNATSSDDYQCNINDIVENYYLGNNESLDILKKSLKMYCSSFNVEEISCENTDIMKHILDTLKIKPTETPLSILKHLVSLFIQNDQKIITKKYNPKITTNASWLILLNKIKYHLYNEDDSITTILNSIFQFYLYNTGKDAQRDFYNSFLSLTDKKNNENCDESLNLEQVLNSSSKSIGESNKKSLLEKFNDRLNELKEKHYIQNLLFQNAIRSIVNQKFFNDKFHELINCIHSYIELHFVKDSLDFNEINSSYKLFVDNDFNFVLQKTYNQNMKKYIRDREKNILKENYSKFIVHCDEDYQENKIIVPYFPCGNLDSLIRKQSPRTSLNLRVLELTNIDKIVIALEIAIAIKDLHSNNEYHGNLASQFIFISSTKDAYIGAIAYDRKLEIDATKPRGPFYYRPPEITYFVPSDQNDENKKEQQLYDIYSFGVLIHELFTEFSPERRMGNKSREERLHLLKDIYDEFLLNNENDDFFNDDSFDIEGNSLVGVKEIIAKCIKKESKNRYDAIDPIIDDFKKLPIYIKNQEEIEYRIENATSSADYQCTMSDLVESFYLGNENSSYDIEKALTLYLKLSSYESFTSFHIQGDIIQSIFDIFEIKYKISDELMFSMNKKFNEIIKKNIKINIDQYEKSSINDQLLLLSLEENFKSENNNNDGFIIPISSLENFIQKNKWPKISPIWAYLIAHEITTIHSKNLFHGNISQKSIGIYYNTKTKMFVPSIIPYYIYYKQKLKDEIIKPSNERSFDFISRMQKKDIKNIIKIIVEMIGPNDLLDNIIDNDASINVITYFLYNLNIQNTEISNIFMENHLNYSYQFFKISFMTFGDILKNIHENNYLINDSATMFSINLKEINDCIDNEILDFAQKSKKIISIKEIDFQHNDIQSLILQFDYVYDKCEKFLILKY